jgi:hypothetical protein
LKFFQQCHVDSRNIEIYGRPLARTWALLTSTALAGATKITVDFDVLGMGWRVGDKIAFGPLYGVPVTMSGKSFRFYLLKFSNLIHFQYI